jgi:hypothetical protein
MAQSFLHLGNVGFILESVGGGGGPQGMHAEAEDHVGEDELVGIALPNVVLHRHRVQGLRQGLGVVVFNRPKQRPVELLGMPGGLQIGGDEPLRQDTQQQVAHLIPLPSTHICCTPFRW